MVDTHPIPKIEELFAALSDGLSSRNWICHMPYLQLLLDDSAREYLVVNTQNSLFEYTRMPFCIASIFQRTMDNLLQGIKHVTVYTYHRWH